MAALFTTSVLATGGREGRVVSEDNIIDFQLVSPKELGGPGGHGTNPEQLFAAGYAACFDGALGLVIRKEKADVSSTSVKADVHFLKDESDGGYKIGVTLNVSVQGVDEEKARELVEKAHQVCPYSKATRDNIDVELKVT
ncbi:Ohr subfamily peroxiredoxin [Planococcus glaciei]|uniref:Organic hydroperoxide resistance protein n=1 Tax=Planococcus glaciei TaxID=459472 RepID=A0A1G7WAW0_9BACL|nr:organic hydroperoxide resistance protein [Planococcus glaciei]ETP69215.1 Organic hydroperoxide resistance protein [Planococcus glaciei CHR43]KOF12099.1 Ohr subfamily peroxiredoxin [Planococcus glaciei]MBX0314462.1 organic hydroperoxide resistance protein [Planococcus glaciei]QKX49867.1 organic hydroperoxide resistance protein [Planococcus glaciei]SDG68230.1 peroxiredoxin, Ohr subfamily [Planococcus glaciei]